MPAIGPRAADRAGICPSQGRGGHARVQHGRQQKFVRPAPAAAGRAPLMPQRPPGCHPLLHRPQTVMCSCRPTCAGLSRPTPAPHIRPRRPAEKAAPVPADSRGRRRQPRLAPAGAQCRSRCRVNRPQKHRHENGPPPALTKQRPSPCQGCRCARPWADSAKFGSVCPPLAAGRQTYLARWCEGFASGLAVRRHPFVAMRQNVKSPGETINSPFTYTLFHQRNNQPTLVAA